LFDNFGSADVIKKLKNDFVEKIKLNQIGNEFTVRSYVHKK